VRAIRPQFLLPWLEVRIWAKALNQLGRAVASASAATVALNAKHLQMPGNVSDSDDATARGRRSVGAFSRGIVLRSPASHGGIEAWRPERVESGQ
jgi:hypothetical protein